MMVPLCGIIFYLYMLNLEIWDCCRLNLLIF